MEQKQENKQTRGRLGRRSILPFLLIFLMIALAVSTGLLGYSLGRNLPVSAGELIDTIVVSSDQGVSGGEEEITHFLSGRMTYAAGDPCQGVTVRLKGSEKSDKTDENGKFFFSDVRSGDHTVEVLDDQGSLLAESAVTLRFQKETSAAAILDAEAAVIEMPANARMLEITLSVDPDTHSLLFRKEGAYVVTTDGAISDLFGNQMEIQENGYSVMPGGDVVSSSGYTLIPADFTVISPEGNTFGAADLTSEDELEAGMAFQEDGTVLLNSGVSVKPGGTVSAAGEEEPVGPAQCLISVDGGGSVIEVPTLPKVQPTASPSPEPEAEAQAVSTPTLRPRVSTAPSGPVPSGEPGEGQGSDARPSSEPSLAPPPLNAGTAPDPTPTPTPEPTEEPTPLPLHMSEYREDGEGQVWTQTSAVDLFKNRTSGVELGEENGLPVIAPGSAGYYDFKLRNDEDFDIRVKLKISEGSFHLPILYSLRDLENNKLYKGNSKTGPDRTLASAAINTRVITLSAHTERYFRLGWNWQFEEWLTPWVDDAYDTAAAGLENRTYIIFVDVSAEQVGTVSAGGGSGARVPGAG